MPKVSIRKIPTRFLCPKAKLDSLREYWGNEPITVYGYDPKGFFVVWDQQNAAWGFLDINYCVPCE